MTIYCRQTVLVALALAAVALCDGVRLGARNEEVEHEAKRYIRDTRDSIVRWINRCFLTMVSRFNSHLLRTKFYVYPSKVEGNDHLINHRETLSCGSDERILNFGFTTDNYGYETSFEWLTLGGVFASGPARGEKFADNASYSYKYCVKIGEQYKLKIVDSSGDGFVSQVSLSLCTLHLRWWLKYWQPYSCSIICQLEQCCKYGNGSYRYGIDGENIYNSRGTRSFTSVGVHTFWVESRPKSQSLSDSVSWFVPRDDSSGFEANMSDRDNEWLTAHNIRRKRYHEEFGKSYVPLKWSPTLAEEAKAYAVEILSDCDHDGIAHEQNVGEGENLAKNEGEGSWGDLYSADRILTRWVEKEIGVGNPGNAHMTQVCPSGARWWWFRSIVCFSWMFPSY